MSRGIGGKQFAKLLYIRLNKKNEEENKMTWTNRFLVIITLITIAFTGPVYGESRSANYLLLKDVFGNGGQRGSSASYTLQGTLGQSSAIGESSGSNYMNQGGFWTQTASEPPLPPDCSADPNDFEHQAMITAVIYGENGESLGANNGYLCAFVGNECRGGVKAKSISSGTRYFLQVWSNQTANETITFTYYDSASGETYTISESVEFQANSDKGTIFSPYEFHIGGSSEIRILLTKGWNWITVNVANEDMTLNTLLSPIDGKGERIVSQNGYAEYDSGVSSWAGSLSEIIPDLMYMLKMTSDDELIIPGNLHSAPLYLDNGWNWIGYLPSFESDLNHALNSVGDNGERIVGQDGYAEYLADSGWWGSLNTLKPNRGYKLKTSSETTLTYPSSSSEKRKPARFVQRDSRWNVNVADYEFSGAITANVLKNQEEMGDEGDELAAFVGDECRGVTLPVETPKGIRFFLQIWSNTDDEIMIYKYYDSSEGQIYNFQEILEFQRDMIIGSISEPDIPLPEGVETYTLTPEVTGENGTITPAAPVEVAEGVIQIFAVTPDGGYMVDTFTDNEEDKTSELVNHEYILDDIQADHAISVAFKLMTGDIDHSSTVDLRDAILALKVVAGMQEDGIYSDNEVNEDGKIGLEETIYILRSIAGLD